MRNNHYLKTYNTGWRNDPNFSWGGTQQKQTNHMGGQLAQVNRGTPPGFHVANQGQHQSIHDRLNQMSSSSTP